MADAGVLERRAGTPRPPEPPPQRRRRRVVLIARRSLTLLLVLIATFSGGYLALVSFTDSKDLSVGEIRMSVSPGHRGAIDLYVPLVDWGARFEVIRLPVRLRVNLQTVNRTVAASLAEGEPLNLDSVRTQARDALAGYLKMLIVLMVLGGAALGLLVAFAIRSRAGPRLRWTSATAIGGALAMGAAMIALIPPSEPINSPQYYAHGPDIPRALEAVEAVRRTPGALDEELNAQFVGLARLVIDPGKRRALAGQPVVTVASDLHNNPFGLNLLQTAARGGPVFFVGDMTDRGSPLETSVVKQAAHLGKPFLFVTGNHDSDFLAHELASEGAVVLTRNGRLMPKGGLGPVIYKLKDGLRVAGYDDPFQRLSAEDFKDRYDNTPDPAQQDAFTHWLMPLIGKVDVVMVHEPALIAPALTILRDKPPSRPLVFMVGHTHHADLDQQPGVTVINGGSVGAGGPSNLTEHTNIGIARFTYTLVPSFQPLAADLVTIDPGTGSSSARRTRLDPESG
jgi:predicted phosphodiesterase